VILLYFLLYVTQCVLLEQIELISGFDGALMIEVVDEGGVDRDKFLE